MFDVLAANPVLTVVLVIATGSLFGLIPFGPVRLRRPGKRVDRRRCATRGGSEPNLYLLSLRGKVAR